MKQITTLNLLKDYNPKKIIIAFSGGIDSSVLLHLLLNCSYINKKKILVIHINYNIQNNAKLFENHCIRLCNENNLEYKIFQYNGKSIKYNIEENLRDFRYKIFRQEICSECFLLTGHHADDNIETFLFRTFRGTGLKGLNGISLLSNYSHGKIFRPLLFSTKQEIIMYANHYNIKYYNDLSNLNTNIDRNYIRHKIMPIIRKKWPGINESFKNLFINIESSNNLLDIYAKIDFDNIYNKVSNCISRDKLVLFELDRIINVLRYYIKLKGFKFPTRKVILNIVNSIICSSYDKTPTLSIHNMEIRRFKNNIYIDSKTSLAITTGVIIEIKLQNKMSVILPTGKLIINKVTTGGIYLDSEKTYTIRYRSYGETIKINNVNKKLKKVMCELNIPPWNRSLIPLLYCDQELIAICGYPLNYKNSENSHHQWSFYVH